MDSVSSQSNVDDHFSAFDFTTSECRRVGVHAHTYTTAWIMLKPAKDRKKFNLSATKVFA